MTDKRWQETYHGFESITDIHDDIDWDVLSQITPDPEWEGAIQATLEYLAEDMRVAQCCSTCKFTMFRKPNYWYFSTIGKKQMGMCLVRCDGLPPRVMKDPWGVDLSDYAMSQGYERRHCPNLYTAAKVGYAPDKETYMTIFEEKWRAWDVDYRARRVRSAERAAESFRGMLVSHPGYKYYRSGGEVVTTPERSEEVYWEQANEAEATIEERYELKRAAVSAYYDEWKINYDWWQANWPLARRCHRVCTCGLWEDGPAKRENVAKSIAKGNGDGAYGLHKEEG